MSEIRFWRAVFSLLGLGVVLLFLFQVWGILLPFVFGLVLAYLIHPLTDRFAARGLRQDRVVIVLFILFLGAGILLGSWFLPELYRDANEALVNLPEYTQKVDDLIVSINTGLHHNLKGILGSRASQFAIPFRADHLADQLFKGLPGNLLNFAHIGLWIFIIPFVTFFALTQGKKWINNLFQVTPAEYVESLLGLLAELNASLGGYVRGVLVESFIVGLLTAVGLIFLGVNGAVLIGFLTALFNIVPFMAMLVGGGIALATGFFQGLAWSTLLGILLLYGAVRLIDDFFIIPFVMGHHVRLHPVVILFAILAGVEVGGFVGLIFAIPIAALVKVVLSVALRSKREAVLTSSQHVFS